MALRTLLLLLIGASLLIFLVQAQHVYMMYVCDSETMISPASRNHFGRPGFNGLYKMFADFEAVLLVLQYR